MTERIPLPSFLNTVLSSVATKYGLDDFEETTQPDSLHSRTFGSVREQGEEVYSVDVVVLSKVDKHGAFSKYDPVERLDEDPRTGKINVIDRYRSRRSGQVLSYREVVEESGVYLSVSVQSLGGAEASIKGAYGSRQKDFLQDLERKIEAAGIRKVATEQLA